VHHERNHREFIGKEDPEAEPAEDPGARFSGRGNRRDFQAMWTHAASLQVEYPDRPPEKGKKKALIFSNQGLLLVIRSII